MRRCLSAFCLWALMSLAWSCVFAQTEFDVKLWESGLPNTNGHDDGEEDFSKGVYAPEIRVFLPEVSKATGRMVLACPGGSYSHIALDNEGYNWAPYFNDMGVAYAVLKYRLPFGNPEVPVSDAVEAMRVIRQHAAEWHVNPHDVGIMGSSAGGHLASTVATSAPYDCRPDFQILFYPVISMELGQTHNGSVYSFIGKEPSTEDQVRYSNERNVRRHLTPPAILLLSGDDLAVPVSNSIKYYTALHNSDIPASLHVYPSGGHGWGFKSSFPCHDQMLADLKAWLDGLKFPESDAVKVACVGNSITDGHGISLKEENAYPAVLGKALGSGYLVKNFGLSGYTMLKNGDHPYQTSYAYQCCKEFNPDIVVVKLGTNDSKPYNWKYKDEFKSDAQQMIDELKSLPSKPEIILALPVKAMSNGFNISDSVIVNGVIPALRQIAEKNSLEVLDLYTVFDGHSEWFLRDGIHPNADGAAVIAREVEKAIRARKLRQE